ncbi:retinol dehydrogenase 16-like isoform X2 [Suncus etruscus]|uniref:retinol dehydrogenase 16-like isoform X2 n=2 Tax=Suncus etruscus TaxID=109475 RepID=UPI0021106771|nr:retinol dehydrogenase 16-like isoform X2 [Suncus etruscus]
MWLYVVALVGLYHLLRWYLERQVVSQLWDKYVFITGCDSGFGNLLAKQLDLRGFRVLAACLTEKGAETLKAQTSDRLETVILDVTNSESIAAATQWVKEHTGDRGLWGLVNNAGISVPTAPNSWMTKQDFMKILDVNLLGVIEVTLSLLPQLVKAKGRVVNFSSIAGRVSIFGGGYCISKYGLEAFSDSLRREVSFFGMQVSIIECGLFKTPMVDSEPHIKALQSLWDQCSPEIKDIYGKNYLASSIKSLQNMDPQICEDLTLVTDCMEHALISCHPRTRYSAGWSAKLIFIPLSYMPTFLADAFLRWKAIKPSKAL